MFIPYSKSFVRVESPQAMLALNVFSETFKNIESYFTGEGTLEERMEGKRGIRWIRRMEGSFRILSRVIIELSPPESGLGSLTIDKIHALCLRRINELEKEAYEKKRMGQESPKSEVGGEPSPQMV